MINSNGDWQKVGVYPLDSFSANQLISDLPVEVENVRVVEQQIGDRISMIPGLSAVYRQELEGKPDKKQDMSQPEVENQVLAASSPTVEAGSKQSDKQSEPEKPEGVKELDVSGLSATEKLVEALKYAILALPTEVSSDVKNLLSPRAIASMVGIFAAYAVSHAAGVGFIADAAFLLAGVAILGRQIIGAVKDLIAFSKAINATTEEELQQAGQHLASAVSTVGISVVISILTKKTLIKIQRNIRNGQRGNNPNQLPGNGGGSITTSSSGSIVPNGRGNNPNPPSIVPTPQLSQTSDSETGSGEIELSSRVSQQFGELDNLDSNTISTLGGLEDAQLAGLNSSLEAIPPQVKGQYLNIIALDTDKGAALIEFRNFETPERFLNVFNAITTADVAIMERVFHENYLDSLVNPNKTNGQNMKTRYEKLLSDVADGNLAPQTPTFTERLKVLDEVLKTQTAVENKVGSNVYQEKGLYSRNYATGDYNITYSSPQTGEPAGTISSDFVSISGKKMPQEISSFTPRQTVEIDDIERNFIPAAPKIEKERLPVIRPTADQDSERKLFAHVLNELENISGKKLDPDADYISQGFSGEINITSQMKPCNSCQSLIEKELFKMFGNDIQVNVKYGVDFETETPATN